MSYPILALRGNSTFFQYYFCYVSRVTGLLPHSRVFSFSYFRYYSAAHEDAEIDVSILCLKTAPDLQFQGQEDADADVIGLIFTDNMLPTPKF